MIETGVKYDKPWGYYEILYNSKSYKVKKIVIDSGKSFSEQYHKYRSEDWVIVEGSGLVSIGSSVIDCKIGDRYHIEPYQVHRATAKNESLIFVEVQRGICDENDIIRLKDDYGRKTQQ
jgi:mannose-1-phosphate guanylyltransferase